MAIHRMRRNHSEVATPVPSQSGTGIRPVCLAVAFPKVFADVPQPVSKETGWKPVPPFAKPLPVFLDVDRSRFPGLVGLESLGLEHRLDGLHHVRIATEKDIHLCRIQLDHAACSGGCLSPPPPAPPAPVL